MVELLVTESAMNPQVAYAEDLMSRISYAMTNSDGLGKMNKATIETLDRLAAAAARQVDLQARDIHEIVFVGNTTMNHVLLGINPVELGGAPFALVNRDRIDIKARELGLRLHPAANVHILPAEAGHVGSDNVGVRIDPLTGMLRFKVIGDETWSDRWRKGPDVSLDEQPKQLAAGICGSGIIEVIVEMLPHGVILPDGGFSPDAQGDRVQWSIGSTGKRAMGKGTFRLATIWMAR